MPRRFNLEGYDLASLGIITLILIFLVARFNYLPQYIDAYYHLSVAEGFIKSGGWVGWSWWDYAPWGRPQLYPPFYHFILVFLEKIGVSGLNSVRVTEVIVPLIFFLSFWWVLKSITHSLFAFLSILSLSSFFSFYSSVSAHIPASLALSFGLMSWYFFKKGRLVSATLLLIFCFYTHTGIALIFFLSFLPVLFILKEYRVFIAKMFFYVLLGSSPIIIHQLRYKEYVRFYFLRENYFTHFSLIITSLGFIALVYYITRYIRSIKESKGKEQISLLKNIPLLLFLGYFGASLLIFFFYPYRFFSAQGVIGLVLLGMFPFRQYFYNLNTKFKKIIFFLLSGYLFFFHSSIDLDKGNPEFNLFNSTYYNFLTGKAFTLLEYNSLFWPQYYYPIVEVIKKNTEPLEIISSNLKIVAQIFSSLSQRPTSNSMLYEVGTKVSPLDIYNFAKVVVWLKPPDKTMEFFKRRLGWQKLYENEIAYVFINPDLNYEVVAFSAAISFKQIGFIITILFLIFIFDNAGNILSGVVKSCL